VGSGGGGARARGCVAVKSRPFVDLATSLPDEGQSRYFSGYQASSSPFEGEPRSSLYGEETPSKVGRMVQVKGTLLLRRRRNTVSVNGGLSESARSGGC
jgi:hypothetical protein